VLDLRSAAALEGLLIAVLGVAEGVPESERRLHAEFRLEGPERGAGVERPVAPGRASQTILEEHPHDGHHGKASVGDLGVQTPCPPLSVVGRKKRRLPAVVAGRGLVDLTADAAGLAPEAVGKDLEPARCGHLGDGREAIGHVCKLQLCRVGQVSRELARDLRGDVAHGREH